MIWFSADAHFSHTKIISYCSRPFKDYKEMDEKLINNWNGCVRPEDMVFYLGDFTFFGDIRREEYKKMLNGNIIFIRGNHDKKGLVPIKSMVIASEIGDIYLCHRPRDYKNNFKLNLVGHAHNKWKMSEVCGSILINVGVDMWDFKPVSMDEILSTYRHRNKLFKNRKEGQWIL